MSVGGEVDVDRVIAVEAWVAANVVGLENREREARKAANVDFVGHKPCSGVHGIVVGRRHVWQQRVPVGLLFVFDHRYHLGHHMVDALDAAVGAGVAGPGVNVTDTKAFVDDVRKLGGNV